VLPVLFTVFGFPVGSYGLSKAVAALVAGLVLARALGYRGFWTGIRR
jgi:phosphatidylglycerol:prolipoprotein diacylglycerol transferase